VERGRDAEGLARRPDRVVVVGAVGTESVEPGRRPGARRGLEGTLHEAREHGALEAEGAAGVLELFDRLPGRVHRHDRHRREPVRVLRVGLGQVAVEGAHDGATGLLLVDALGQQTVGRVEHREVDPELVEAFVEEPRQHRRRAIQRVARRETPPGRTHEAHAAPLLGCEPDPELEALVEGDEAALDVRAADLAHEIPHRRQVLDAVPVGIDDRVIEARAHGLRRRLGRHASILRN
jgi:hypothetical protein